MVNLIGLCIQENEIQNGINSFIGYDFNNGVSFDFKGYDKIYLDISGFDNKLPPYRYYDSLLEQEDAYDEDLTPEANKYWNGDSRSFVKIVLSIKRNTFLKLEQQINNWIELEQIPQSITQQTAPSNKIEKTSQQNKKGEKTPDQLTVKQIALIHIYEHKQITRENAGKIAEKHGYTSKTSGEGLFQDYTTYCSPQNRKGKPTPCTPKKIKNKIELFKSILKHLTESAKKWANDEIKILETILENENQ